MHADLQLLIHLQELDLAAERDRRRIADIPTARQALDERLVAATGGVEAVKQRLAANQQALTAQVDGSREQLSGVNLDEEMTLLLAHQRAYEAAARVMSTVDTVLDTLINRTGLVR